MSRQLAEKTNIAINGSDILLNYYITQSEKSVEDECVTVYGIGVDMEGVGVSESSYVEDVTSCGSSISRIAKRLSENAVLPSELIDIVEDLVIDLDYL